MTQSNSSQNVQLSYKFNIVNMYKKYQLYCVGQQPLAYSTQKVNSLLAGMGSQWTKEGFSGVKYGPSKFILNTPSGKRKNLFQLSFTYDFSSSTDDVFFAYSIPFTYSNLNQSISEYRKLEKSLYSENNLVFDS